MKQKSIPIENKRIKLFKSQHAIVVMVKFQLKVFPNASVNMGGLVLFAINVVLSQLKAISVTITKEYGITV